MSRVLRKIISAVISVGLLVYLAAQLDFSTLWTVLANAIPGWVVAAFVVFLGDRILMAWKWWLLLGASSSRLSIRAAVKEYYISGFIGFAAPGGIGPDVVRFARVRNLGVPGEIVLASVLVERLLGTVATAAVAALSLVLLWLRWSDNPVAGIGLQLFIGFLAGSLLLLLVVIYGGRIIRSLGWGQPPAFGSGSRLSRYVGALTSFPAPRKTLAIFLSASTVEQFAPVLAVYFAAKAISLPVGFIEVLSFVPLSTILQRLPISIMGLGVREATFAFFLGHLGVPSEQAVLLGLVTFALFLLSLAPAGLWWVLGDEERSGAVSEDQTEPNLARNRLEDH